MVNTVSPQQDYSNWDMQRLKFHKFELEQSSDWRDRHTRKRVAAIIRDREEESQKNIDHMATVYFKTAYWIEDKNFHTTDQDALTSYLRSMENNVRANINKYPFAELFTKYREGIITDFEVVSDNYGRIKIKTFHWDFFVFDHGDVREWESLDLMDAYVLINERTGVYSDQYPVIPKGSIITDIWDCDFRVHIKDGDLRDRIYGDRGWGYANAVQVAWENISIAPFAKCKISEIYGRNPIEYSLHMS